MNTIATKDNLLRPARSRAETKADITNRVAQTIIETEARVRDAKTAKIRKARLASQALIVEPAAPDAKPRTRAARKRPAAA